MYEYVMFSEEYRGFKDYDYLSSKLLEHILKICAKLELFAPVKIRYQITYDEVEKPRIFGKGTKTVKENERIYFILIFSKEISEEERILWSRLSTAFIEGLRYGYWRCR